MARLRDHEKYGKSVKCATFSPYVKDEGPSFTLHLFDTGRAEDGLKVVAYELWQREPDGKRTGLINGEDFLSADPKHDSAVAALIEKLVVAPAGFDPSADQVMTEFYQEHAKLVNEDARLRFAPRNVKRPRKVRTVEETAEPAPAMQSAANSSAETANAVLA